MNGPACNTVFYFSYGSNMSSRRLRERIPAARFVSVARLDGYELNFHKRSRLDGSGKCDVRHTGKERDCVIGVVFDMPKQDQEVLDGIEGNGHGYLRQKVEVRVTGGDVLCTFTYRATEIDGSLKPYQWYKEHVLIGAREHGLPHEYIRRIENVESLADPDPERHARELSIYQY